MGVYKGVRGKKFASAAINFFACYEKDSDLKYIRAAKRSAGRV